MRLLLPWLAFCLLVPGVDAESTEKPPISAEAHPTFEAFAKDLERQIRACDRKALEAAWEVNLFVDRIVEPFLDYAEHLPVAQIRDGLADSAGDLLSPLCEREGMTFRRIRMRDDEVVALYRAGSLLGLNYIELLLRRDQSGSVRVGDVFLASSESWNSRGLFSTLAGLGADLLGEATTEQIDALNQMTLARKELSAGRAESAADALDRVPAPMNESLEFITLRIMVTQDLGREDYRDALSELAPHVKKYPGLHLLSLDHYMFEKDWDSFLNGLEELRAAYGPDPFLDVVQANMEMRRGKYEAARKLIDTAISAEPTLEQAHVAKLLVSAHLGDYDACALAMQILEGGFGYNMQELATHESLREFAETDEYKKLIEWRNAPPVPDGN